MLNIILFGPPGAGKGTQSKKLIDKYNLLHISTGDLLRTEISLETKLGLEAKMYMNEGSLVPDAVVIGMIEKRVADPGSRNGIIFDGFPRTVAQAGALDNLMHKQEDSITTMIALEVPENELVARLLARGKIEGRSDDNEEVIRKRIDVYERETRPVADYYSKQGKFFDVNGSGEIHDIFARITAIVDQMAEKERVE